MTLSETGRVVLVGAGKMGGAMLAGWLAGGLRSATIVDPNVPDAVARLAGERGLTIDDGGGRLDAEIVVLAVKPQVMDAVLSGLAPRLPADALAVSIAAGRTIGSLAGLLGEGRPIVRAMPNTPAAIGRGITVACANSRVGDRQRQASDALLRAVGSVEWVEDEGLIDAVTAVSGSGPAYVFWMAECLAAAGRDAGLPPALAETLARATVCGAGALLDDSDEAPETLRRNVTSPGGTTAAALDVLMADDGLKPLVARAVSAAARRSRELAG